MKESTVLKQELTVEARDSGGRLKAVRYVTKIGNGAAVEFIPNRLYLKLMRRGAIRPGSWKIPYLLGTRKTEK